MTDSEFQEKEDSLLLGIPEEFRGALSYQAYQRGHSAGMSEVLMILTNLVYDMEQPIKESLTI